MSEERFDRIEQRLDRLETGQERLREDLGQELRAVNQELGQQLREDLGQELRALNQALRQQLRADLGKELRALNQELGRQLRDDLGQQLRVLGDDLGRQMRVLHEDLVDRIKALPEHTGPTRAEFDGQKQHTELRLNTLELAVRQHSADIEQLKHSRG